MLKKHFVLYTLYFISTIIILYGLGYTKDWDNKNIIVAFMFFFGYLFGARSKYTLIILLISFSIISIYFPTGIIYGKPTAAILEPLLQTNKLEIIGYLLAIRYKILLSILFILIQILIYKCAKYHIKGNNYIVNIIFVIIYIISLFGISIKNYQFNDDAFLKNSIFSLKTIHAHKKEFQESIQDDSDIKIKSKIDYNDDTEIRIVVIGESVRKDYMSVYGYPNTTTPFLNNAKGIFIDGLVSAGPSTNTSLNRALFKVSPDENNIQWGVNFVSLANKSGYETYWISNQGTEGWGDDVFYGLSKLATHSNFLKQGGFTSEDHDDDEMLPILSRVINVNSKNKVIFLHMMGSHEPVCSRIGTYKPNFSTNNEAGCYAATIEKLDTFIKKITEIVRNKRYKLMYFSDHGLSVAKNRSYHDVELYEEYQVPLFYLDSNIDKHIYIKKSLSGLNLIDIYSTFINIKSNVTNEKYNFNLANKIPENSDPLIYWEKYKHISSIQKKQKPITNLQSKLELKNVIKLKDNYSFSNKCISYIENINIAFPSVPHIYKIHGWMATADHKEPISETVGSFIVNDKKVLFVEGEHELRPDVHMYFNLNANIGNDYGLVAFLDRKFVKKKNSIYIGYKDDSDHYYICQKLNQ